MDNLVGTMNGCEWLDQEWLAWLDEQRRLREEESAEDWVPDGWWDD